MAAPLDLQFVTSAPTPDHLPHSRYEVAIIGRSNVGKSSLLNALANQKGLAKTSSKPGKTQLLNCFRAGHEATVIDLPGFGYAITGKAERRSWQDRMETYLTTREPLVLALLLVDGAIGPAKLDVEMLDWLRRHEVPIRIVATKHDKVKSSQRVRRKRDLAAGCDVTEKQVLWVSAEKGVGIDRLRTYLRGVLDGADPDVLPS